MEKMNKETAVFAVPPFELERINNTEYFNGIAEHIARQLCDRLIDILDTEKELIVMRSDLITVAELGLHQVQFRETICWRPLVRFKDCKWWDRSCESIVGSNFCPNVDGERDGMFFCEYGERREDEQSF